jgi:hypothetical protein
MQTKKNPSHPYKVSPSQEFKDGMAVLRMCGNVSRIVYLEAIGHLEDKWPGRGWLEAAQNLEKWYDKHDKPLTGKTERIQFKDAV